MIEFIEYQIKQTENAIQQGWYRPEKVKEAKEQVIELRRALEQTKATRQKWIDQEAKPTRFRSPRCRTCRPLRCPARSKSLD